MSLIPQVSEPRAVLIQPRLHAGDLRPKSLFESSPLRTFPLEQKAQESTRRAAEEPAGILVDQDTEDETQQAQEKNAHEQTRCITKPGWGKGTRVPHTSSQAPAIGLIRWHSRKGRKSGGNRAAGNAPAVASAPTFGSRSCRIH